MILFIIRPFPAVGGFVKFSLADFRPICFVKEFLRFVTGTRCVNVITGHVIAAVALFDYVFAVLVQYILAPVGTVFSNCNLQVRTIIIAYNRIKLKGNHQPHVAVRKAP